LDGVIAKAEVALHVNGDRGRALAAVAGIVTERDVLRAVAANGQAAAQLRIASPARLGLFVLNRLPRLPTPRPSPREFDLARLVAAGGRTDMMSDVQNELDPNFQ
jgi:hypothetical protein